MRALITGGGGQLARQLVATAPTGLDVNAVNRADCDIADPLAVQRVFDSFRPDVVINTAAFTSVDAAEENPDLAFLINAQGAENVARSAERAGVRLIHISTDYVFDGRQSTPYQRDAPTSPLNVYGASKLEGEIRVIRVAPSALIIRAGWLYSLGGKSFVVKMLELLHGERPLRVVNDQVGCPTSALEFAGLLWRAKNAKLGGVYHWANLGAATWYDFASEVSSLARQLGIRTTTQEIVGVTSEEYGARAKRPRYSVLDSTALVKELHVTPAYWRDALRSELTRRA